METAQTADYALRALLELESRDGQTIAELTERLSLSRTIAQRVITTLHRRGGVLRDLDNRYWLGPLLMSIARDVPDALAVVAGPLVHELSGRVAETVIVSRDEGEQTVIVARANGGRSPLRVEYEVGFRQPLSRGGASLAILAHRDATLARKLLGAEEIAGLARIRAEGYARTEGQMKAGTVEVAAPIFDGTGVVVGSLGIVVPSARSEPVPTLVPDLLRTAETLSERFRLYIAQGDVLAAL